MSNFKIGDRIICVNNSIINSQNVHLPPLTLHKEYIVSGVAYCRICGSQVVNVGLFTIRHYYRCVCSAIDEANGIHWCASKRFVKIDEIEDSIKELLTETIYKKEPIEILQKNTL